ncbi:hypothetical protein [Lactobacillus mulieris]|uniref:hypothetical protein n=1 Tax=Lactobacillus mulieris TaxID=2508708 RepID=UPI002243F4D7|nr:hypothetical protein [Lactobacillus mulieris]MCW8123421.1 hypothetical protein [Lactobacillus mulieris]MDK7326584.1 hypothetical protein [Lactobacillus mulieris]
MDKINRLQTIDGSIFYYRNSINNTYDIYFYGGSPACLFDIDYQEESIETYPTTIQPDKILMITEDIKIDTNNRYAN